MNSRLIALRCQPIWFCALLSCAAISADGAVEWKTTKRVLSCAAQDTLLLTEFRFRNGSDDKMSLVKVRTSCGCVTAQTEKTTYQAGECGEITVALSIGERSGVQRQTIDVAFSNGEKQRLTVETDVPQLFDIDAKIIRWNRGDALTAKHVRIQVVEPYRASIASVKSLSGSWSIAPTCLEEGRSFDLSITPKSTATATSDTIVVETDHPIAPRARIVLDVAVNPPSGNSQ